MVVTDDLTRVRTALDGLKVALAADQFDFDVRDYQENRLEVLITERRGACPECMISQQIMAAIIRSQLPSDIVTDDIVISVSRQADA